MSDGVSAWLSAREPIDMRSRSSELARAFMDKAKRRKKVIDLGSGTGSNIRFLSNFSDVEFVAVDSDPDMLRVASSLLKDHQVEYSQLDVATQLDQIPSGPDVSVTASAFLDLVSQGFIELFASAMADNPLLITMTSVGQPVWDPLGDPVETAEIDACILMHQQSDHGFGPSLGPDAHAELCRQLTQKGCSVQSVRSDWKLSHGDELMMRSLIFGIERRLKLLRCPVDVDAWRSRRETELNRGELTCVLPHADLLSLPVVS